MISHSQPSNIILPQTFTERRKFKTICCCSDTATYAQSAENTAIHCVWVVVVTF
jgi:hypothetical protein